MSERIEAPEVLPRCPVCGNRVFCITDAQLAKHIQNCDRNYLRQVSL